MEPLCVSFYVIKPSALLRGVCYWRLLLQKKNFFTLYKPLVEKKNLWEEIVNSKL